MNAFETIVAQYLEDQGYWVKISVKINITKDDKKEIGLPSMPRPEIDLVAYNAGRKELLLIEAKSFLDSPGVRYQDVSGSSKRYRLFTDVKFRDIVTKRLLQDYLAKGLISTEVTAKYALAAGKIYSDNEPDLRKLFYDNGWILITPAQIKDVIKDMANKGYEDNVITVTAKLILREIANHG